MNNVPFFSIIIAAYNAENCITETVNSVLSQSFEDYEVVIKDANSTDQTLQRIPASNKIRIISKNDRGIYDGMNEGILEATGKFLLFLNCGDDLASTNVLEQLASYMKENNIQNRAIVYGNYTTNNLISILPEKMSKEFLLRKPLCHQAMFFSADLFHEFGLYDERYKIMADYDFTLKCFTNNISFYHVDCTVCTYLGGGFSTQNNNLLTQERKQILISYFSKKDRFVNRIWAVATLQKFRIYLSSEKSPDFVRKGYKKIANIINK